MPIRIIAITAILLLVPLSAYAGTSVDRILSSLERGELTAAEAAHLLTLSAVDHDALPAEFREGTDPVTCGTPALLTAWSLSGYGEPAGVSRPSLSGPEYALESPSGRFKVHWTDAGGDSTTYDYALSIALAADISWQVQCDEMGFHEPPPDNGAGGDDLYDIYVLHLTGGVLGYSTSAGEYKPPDSTQNCSASHIAVSNSIGDQVLRDCVVAHEFHHAVQAAYDYGEPVWFVENCAVWMTEMVFPDADDHLGNISSGENALRTPWLDIRATPYGGFPWPWKMWDRWGYESVRSVWEYCAAVHGNNTLQAHEWMFADHGATFEEFFMDYGLWRWFTADNWFEGCGMFNEDASMWLPGPRVLPWHEVTSLPFSGDQTPYFPPDTWGIHWIRVDLSQYQDQWIQMYFNGRDLFQWNLGVIMQDLSGRFYFEWHACDPETGEATVSVGADGWDYAVFFPAFVDETSLDHLYEFEITSLGTGIETPSGQPARPDLRLSANPVGSDGTVIFELPEPSVARLVLYDMSGRAVSTLFEGEAGAGIHEVGLGGGELPTGNFFVMLHTEGRTFARRFLLIE